MSRTAGMSNRRTFLNRGFNIMELMIVVAIIGILTSIAIPSYNNYSIKAKIAAALAEASIYKTEIAFCFISYNNINQCNSGENSIPEASGRISSVDKGSIIMDINASCDNSDTKGVIRLNPIILGSQLSWKFESSSCDQFLPKEQLTAVHTSTLS